MKGDDINNRVLIKHSHVVHSAVNGHEHAVISCRDKRTAIYFTNTKARHTGLAHICQIII